jgi:hypothetical protein
MQLRDRDLELNLVGDDVELLQNELQTIGLPIDAEERAGKVFGRSTHQAVVFLQNVYAGTLLELGWQRRAGVVDRSTATIINRLHDRILAQRASPPLAGEPEYIVAGSVQNARGEPVVGATVTVSHQNLVGAEKLRAGTTSDTGTFEIAFDFEPQATLEKRLPSGSSAPDLRFEVLDAEQRARAILGITVMTDGREMPIARIARSAEAPFIVVNASKHTQVLFYVDEAAGWEGLSEFEEVESLLAPVLKGLSYEELIEGNGRFQVSLLAAQTGVAHGIVERLVASAQSSRATQNHPPMVPVAVFYGLAHASLPTDLQALSRLARKDITSALYAAIDDAVIPKRLTVDVDRHVDTILSVGAEQALSYSSGDKDESPRAWLELSGLTDQGQRLLMREMADHEGPLEQLWERLRDHEALGGVDTMRRAELMMRLSHFTEHNLALVRLLMDTPDIRSAADVATLDEPHWNALVELADVPERLHQAGESAADARKRYAQSLMRSAQVAFPTATIQGLVARSYEELGLDPEVSRWLGAARRAAESGLVPELDLRSTHIDRYFDEHGARIELQVERMDRLRADLKRIQRTLSFVEEPAWVAPLLRNGHDSALKVAHLPVKVFLETQGEPLGAENARRVHIRAQQVHFAHLFVHTLVFDAINDGARKI